MADNATSTLQLADDREHQIDAGKPTTDVPALELSDIQATVLRPRPASYRGQYVVLRIDDVAQGREMLHRIIPYVAPADDWWRPTLPGWLGIAFTHEGLKALGAPQASLDSFPQEFREGMAAAQPFLMMSVETLRPSGSISLALRTCMSRWRSTPRTTRAWR